MEFKLWLLIALIVIGVAVNGLFLIDRLIPDESTNQVPNCPVQPSTMEIDGFLNCSDQSYGLLCSLPDNKYLIIMRSLSYNITIR